MGDSSSAVKSTRLSFADVLGVYDVYRGSPHAAIANAVQVPVNDPLLLIPAMAYVTRNLGFGVTCAVSYVHLYTLARRFSTLDHLTGGRIGWNVVTGYLNSAAKGIGLARQPEHDTRYEIAEEYMQIVYKLWEGSWEDEGGAPRPCAARVRAAGEGASHPTRRQAFPDRCDPPLRTLAAADTAMTNLQRDAESAPASARHLGERSQLSGPLATDP